MKPFRLGGLFVLAVLVHAESLSYWFVSTDTFALIRSSRVQSGRDLVATLSQPMMHGTGFTNVALFYRPLSSLSYALDYWLWGLDPTGFHATNLVLHGLAVVLAAVVVAEVTGLRRVGLLAGGLFALHPLTAEVVPVVARRQDIVMLVFLLASLALFIRGRRVRSPVMVGGSLVAYGLALAAKEPALLLPAMVFVWGTIDRGHPDPWSALVAGVRAVVPFALVTTGYLAVRVAVLGGLGGYLARPSLTVDDLPVLVAKYVLSMWYPVDAVGVGAAVNGAWLLVPAVLAILTGALLGWAILDQVRTGVSPRAVALLGTVLGLGAVLLLLVLDGATLTPLLAPIGYVGSPETLPFAYPYPAAASPLIGLALVGTALAAALWTVMGHPSVLRPADRRALGFFGVWLLLPIGLFYRSGDYAIRSGYPSLVPAMAILAVLLVAGIGRPRWRVTPAPALTAAILLLVVPMVAATPALHPYDGWSVSGEVNRLTLTGIESQLSEAPDEAAVRVVGVPNGIQEQQRAFPRVASIGYLGPGSIEAWLAMRNSGAPRRVMVEETITLDRRPHGAAFRTEANGGAVTVRVRYVTGSSTPSEQPVLESGSQPPAEAPD